LKIVSNNMKSLEIAEQEAEIYFFPYFLIACLQRFDAVGWAAGMASGL